MRLHPYPLFAFVSLLLASCAASAPVKEGASAPPVASEIEVIVLDPDGFADLEGVGVTVTQIELFLDIIPRVTHSSGVRTRVESCDVAAADPDLGGLPCSITEMERWRTLGNVGRAVLDAQGRTTVVLPDAGGRYRVRADYIDEDGVGCGWNGLGIVPEGGDQVAFTLEGTCS